MRNELLDAYLFYSLEDVRLLTEQWRVDYNEERHHEALGNVPTAEYLKPISLKN
jgi:putative transposase